MSETCYPSPRGSSWVGGLFVFLNQRRNRIKLLWILTGIELESVRKRKRYVAPKSLASKTSHVHATKNLFLFPCVYRLVLLRFSGIAL
jgi:hypothetical protein